MKITFEECGQCFAVHLDAETLQDAALLTRFSINHTAEIRSAGAEAHADGSFSGYIVIAKHQHPTSDIPQQRGRK